MDKTGESRKKRRTKNTKSIVSQLRSNIDSAINEIKSDSRSLTKDLIFFTVGFLLSRCQLILGARPLGIAFIAVLQNGILPALLGEVIGSLSLGIDGIIFAVAGAITALLRVAVSASERRENNSGELFGESLLLRISVAILSAFLVAVYEVVMRELNEATLLFGLVMIISTPILTFLLSGISSTGINFWDVLCGSKDILNLKGCERQERYDKIFFQLSILLFLFFISLSFQSVNILGISFSYIFSGLMSLLTAKRFGAMRAMTVGFITAMPLSGALSVSFALSGLAAGVMIGYGAGYAIVLGGVALSAWGAYSAGLSGLISTVPEYIIAAAIALPMLNKIGEITQDESSAEHTESAEDMVGTMALVYQKEYSGAVDSLGNTLSDLASIIQKYTSSYFIGGTEYHDNDAQEIAIDRIEEYKLISHLINQAIATDNAEKMVDNSVNDTLTGIIEKCGLTNGLIRVFGNRERHFIIAGEDEGGKRISSFELRKAIESAIGVKLGAPEYYRKGKMTLMECGIRPSLKVSYAIATQGGSKSEVSGDSAICFESKRGCFYSLISDGMGSGDVAKETSEFVCEFLKRAMDIGTGKETLIHMLNHGIREGREECSATIDLLELDLLRGGGVFIKSGSPPSYIKRDSSIFRIRSHTAPIGLMRSIDTERISVEIKAGDYIFMFSDGIAEIAEDAPWLLLLLSEPPMNNLKEYAEYILTQAQKNGASGDDMTVTVIRVSGV